MKKFTLVLLILLCFSSPVLADGKFYTRENVPLDLPYQRALIAHDGSRELLILQSKFEGEAEDFGWVVPLPTVPELASMDSEHARMLFWQLDGTTAPYVVGIKALLYFLVLLFCLTVLACLAVIGYRRYRLGQERPRFLLLSLPAWLLLSFLVAIAGAIVIPNLMGTGIRFLKSEQVGVYNVKVIAGDNSEELIMWLNENGYKFEDADKKAFDIYIDKGWCFVTARVNLKKAEEEGFGGKEGLVNPLVMLFEARKPVYPLALTGTMGKETEILLYVAANHKMQETSERFKMRFAGGRGGWGRLLDTEILYDPPDFGKKLGFKPNYITKLKARLPAEQMQEDLILEQAPDDEPYREVIYHW